MKCPECHQDRQQKDFMNGKCFRCVYKEKLKITEQVKYCKRCENKIENNRWIFCSEKCFKEHTQENNNSHWSKKIQIESKSWKKNRDFIFTRSITNFY